VFETLPALVRGRALANPDSVAMREKRYGVWREITWGAYWEQVVLAAHALLALGVDSGDRVSIHSEDRPEWLVLDMATVAVRGITVGLYPTNPAAEVRYLLEDSGACVHLAEDQEQADKLMEVIESLPAVRTVIHVEPRGFRAYGDDPRFVSWEEFLELGRSHRASSPTAVEDRMVQARPDDVMTLVYTSGTTGPPKGAMLDNANVAYCIERLIGSGDRMPDGVAPGPSDQILTYLPLCHAAERIFSTWTSAAVGTVLNFAESIDTALESSTRGIRALKISFGVLMATALVQAVIVWLTGSVALLADTIHNFSDALTAVPLFIAFKLGRRAATRRYTYGYSRAEDLAGLFVVLMILLSAIIAIWESVERLIHPRPIEYVGILFAAGIVGFLGNELVALYRIRVGRQIGSAALVADGYHARVDGLTSLAVAVGAVLVWLGLQRADPIVGIIVGIMILRVLWSAVKEIYARMMDAVDPALVDEVELRSSSVPGVLGVNSCQVRWLGHRLRADISIGVDSSLTVGEGHHIGETVEEELRREVRFLDVIFVHVDSADEPRGAEHHQQPSYARSGVS